MTTIRRAAAIAAAACLVAGTAAAQQSQSQTGSQGQFDKQAVTQFFQTAQKNVQQAVRNGNLQQIVQWTENYIADGATLTNENEIYQNKQRKRFSATTLDKEDLVRWGRVALSSMQEMFGRQLKNYDLSVDVKDVRMLGPDSAAVDADVQETATIRLPGDLSSIAQGQGGSQAASGQSGSDQSSQSASAGNGSQIDVQVDATCHYIVFQGQNADHPMIGETTCTSRTKL